MAKAQTIRKESEQLAAKRLAFSLATLREAGVLQGPRSVRVSARIEPGLVRAAKKQSGIQNETDLVRAALALMAVPDDFVAWLKSKEGAVPKSFRLVR